MKYILLVAAFLVAVQPSNSNELREAEDYQEDNAQAVRSIVSSQIAAYMATQTNSEVAAMYASAEAMRSSNTN